jgi:hypothetical protein
MLHTNIQVLQAVTLELSRKGVPTICKILPLYKLMETRLADEHEFEDPQIARALRAGSEKAKQYVGKALISHHLYLFSHWGGWGLPKIKIENWHTCRSW